MEGQMKRWDSPTHYFQFFLKRWVSLHLITFQLIRILHHKKHGNLDHGWDQWILWHSGCSFSRQHNCLQKTTCFSKNRLLGIFCYGYSRHATHLMVRDIFSTQSRFRDVVASACRCRDVKIFINHSATLKSSPTETSIEEKAIAHWPGRHAIMLSQSF